VGDIDDEVSIYVSDVGYTGSEITGSTTKVLGDDSRP